MHRVLTLLLVTTATASLRAASPNVIVIIADDQGSADLGCYGAKDLHTPHTDELTTRGVRFTQFYSAAPVCSPSRAGLLTERWPVRAGVPGNCASQKGAKGALPSEEITMAEMFRAAGYSTAHIGKWYIGYTPETMPLAQGFDTSFGHMGGCIDNYSHFFYWSGPNTDWAVREGDWKLVGHTRDTTDGRQPVALTNLLFNIKNDPHEVTNLADRHPDLVNRLQRLHTVYLD